MAVHFVSSDPALLLERLKNSIDEDRLTAWTYDADGDFTRTSDRWSKEAWFRPALGKTKLSFFILAPKEAPVTRQVYGAYHGRMVQDALNYCDDYFETAQVSAYAEADDRTDP